MTPHHHPGDDLLWDYASGSLREPVALIIATHIAHCPVCRTEVGRMEDVGGALLDSVDFEPISDTLLQRTLAGLDAAPAPSRGEHPTAVGDDWVPRPLRDYLGGPVDTLDWKDRRFGPSMLHLLTERTDFDTRLLRIRAGAAMPLHTHDGEEYTVVLRGGFTDESGHFGPGDLALADPSTVHAPIADRDEDCYCLAVTTGSLRLVGPLGRLLNPFVRY
jgi:putative transcriptional regulator